MGEFLQRIADRYFDAKLERWYMETYPDDEDVIDNLWLHVGYENGLMEWVTDVYEAFQDYRVNYILSGRTAATYRRFARAYAKGVQDRPVIVQATAGAVSVNGYREE